MNIILHCGIDHSQYHRFSEMAAWSREQKYMLFIRERAVTWSYLHTVVMDSNSVKLFDHNGTIALEIVAD